MQDHAIEFFRIVDLNEFCREPVQCQQAVFEEFTVSGVSHIYNEIYRLAVIVVHNSGCHFNEERAAVFTE